MTATYSDVMRVQNAVTEARRDTISEIRDLRREFRRTQEDSQRQTADALNRVADALTALTGEIKALRRDLNPELDKSVKLSAPKGNTP